jgi:hypothetical protein
MVLEPSYYKYLMRPCSVKSIAFFTSGQYPFVLRVTAYYSVTARLHRLIHHFRNNMSSITISNQLPSLSQPSTKRHHLSLKDVPPSSLSIYREDIATDLLSVSALQNGMARQTFTSWYAVLLTRRTSSVRPPSPSMCPKYGCS